MPHKYQLYLTIGLMIILSACGAAAPTEPPPATPTPTEPPVVAEADAGPIELVVWASDHALHMVAPFEEQHPGVKVIIEDQGWDHILHQNLLNALRVGTAPDVVIGENFFHELAEAGELLPLDEAISDMKDDLIPGTYKSAMYDGHIYGLSAFTGVFVFERNCQVVSAAGLDCETPPQTWDELLEHARIITEQGQGDYYGYSLQGPVGPMTGGIFRMAVFLNQAGASLCQDENCTQPYFDNPQAVPVMEFLRELNQYTPPGLTFNPEEGQVYTPLFQGKSAYQIAGSWHPGWATETGCADCRYSVIPVPEGGKSASMVVGNIIYAVLKQTDHPEIATEWVKFVASPAMQDQVYPVLGRLPSTRGALTRLRPNVDPATQIFIDELLNNPDLEVLPQWRQPQQLWRIYNDMLTEVLSTDRPIEEIMAEAQAAAEEVVAQ